MRRRAVLLVVALVAGLVPFLGLAQADPPTHATGYIPVASGTADETTLHYKVMLPDATVWGPGPYPAVIDYSGYVPALNVYDGLDDRFIAAGYAVVGLNVRGSACSGGKFDYFERRQAVDGVEAIAWLAKQKWSNGKFGMVGKSYPGITQLFVAGARAIEAPVFVPGGSPVKTGDGHRTQQWIDKVLADHLAAIVPGHVFADLYRDVPYPGGIQNVTFAGGWSAQRVSEGFIEGPKAVAEGRADQQCLANQAQHAANPPFNPFVQALQPQNNFDSDFFRERSPFWWADQIATPTFLVQSWQDEQVGSRATHLLERLPATTPWKLLATNGDHGEYYGDAVFPHILRFLSYHLKKEIPAGEGGTVTETREVTEPEMLPNGKPHPVKTTTRTETTTREKSYDEALAEFLAEDRVILNWETSGSKRTPRWTTTHESWPVADTVDRLYATANGGLAPEKPSTAGKVDYRYTPGTGSQERGGYPLLAVPAASWADRPADGTFASFTTAPLSTDKVLAGPASVDLFLSSTNADTDLEVTMTEVRPDGLETFVQQGWLRASHRKEVAGLSTPVRPFQSHQAVDSQPLVPGKAEKMRVEIFPFGHVFRAGSQLRITVAAPHVKPDLWGFTLLPTPSLNSIHTGGELASSVALPLVSTETAQVRDLPTCNLTMGALRNQPCRPEPRKAS